MERPDLSKITQRLLKEVSTISKCEPTPTLQNATGEFINTIIQNKMDVPKEILEVLPTLPPAGAAWIAVVLGSMAEQGLNPRLGGTALVELLRQWLAQRPFTDQILEAFTWLGQALVAHLARDPDLRADLADERTLIEALDDASMETNGALWLHELLLRRSGPLVVLHVESRRGMAMRYENVGTCFHLFSLVQAAIGTRLPGGREPDQAVLDAATGKTSASQSDSAWWHYQDRSATKANFMDSLWAEWSVSDILELDGVKVLLLWPPILGSRSWDSSFFGPPLDAAPSRVVLERELDPTEAERLFKRIGIPQPTSQ